ncbi:16S rRNA (cytosine(967)-C(5))-methyltransferase RsmB [Aneurinibacillus sp. Ricciae_BoGa-3]|uniref:16S rRNA (cytosine(967)-C(5))-methyltransferase RsmB n=1 Tax=Aneurinibacillus sp. Ricciae_BoGa-3 TaxID=3022697 RepID=UPI00233FCE62|nr:16S rRNA (cytosine(967)-C(5))-methyltransferase RsmB [Aneurinibacillus sp. Ricciae_BoGa-3]WCK53037.1 16S rRNA (cytosine(967)-C(5))-methyltransferase RsmB [Aneurinibacillus sp. Ricciae_BoGa-3]
MSKRIKKPSTAREWAVYILVQVEEKQAYSNLELKEALAHAGLSSRDTNLVTELVYGTLTRLNTIDWMLSRYLSRPSAKLEGWVRNLLRISFYQISYLDRIPDRAVVHEAVEIAKSWGHQGIAGMVNGVLRSRLRQPEKAEIPNNLSAAKRISLVHSHPEWMVAEWIKRYGMEETERMCEENNLPPEVSLRANSLKTDRDKLAHAIKEQVEDASVQPSSVAPEGLVIRGTGNIAALPAYRQGSCTVQDESSMLVAHAVAPKPGMSVLDTCAAPGGKTTHIAELMNNQGAITALDIHPHKLDLIADNARRLGLSIIDGRQANAVDADTILTGYMYDRVLVDAPCSGLGVIRRKPDIKWRKTASDTNSIRGIQLEILEAAAKLVKPEGRLVYSTCTVQAEENEDLIQDFLNQHADWELDGGLVQDMPESVRLKYSTLSRGYMQILPHHFHSDGFFIARLKRKISDFFNV